MSFRCDFSYFKTKPDANTLFGTLTHRRNRYDINARVTYATYYGKLSKRSHLRLGSWVAKTCTNMSRLKHIPPGEQPLQFQSGYFLNKPYLSQFLKFSNLAKQR